MVKLFFCLKVKINLVVSFIYSYLCQTQKYIIMEKWQSEKQIQNTKDELIKSLRRENEELKKLLNKPN